MRSQEVLVLVALAGLVVLAVVGMRVVGRRAARTVDQVNELLERNEAPFQAMVRDSNDIMAIVDPNGPLVYASPATERILGLDIEPLIGTDVFDLIHPDDRRPARSRRSTTSPRTARRPTASSAASRHADGGVARRRGASAPTCSTTRRSRAS